MDNLFENLYKINHSSQEDQIKDLLERTWQHVAEQHCMQILSEKSYDGAVDRHNLVKVEVSADDVRNAVYCNMMMWEHTSPGLYDYWFDMPVEKQDKLLRDVFPNNKVYGV